MKKKNALLFMMAFCLQSLLTNFTCVAADGDVIVPIPDDTVNVLAYENFENGLEKWTYWDGQDRSPSAEDGNVDGTTGSHVLNCVEYNYYMAGTGWKDYTLEVNWFAERYEGSWPAINFQISGGKKNNLYIASGDELVLETRDGGYYNTKYNFKNDNGKWAYFRIEHYGDNVKVFYNSKTEPLLDVTETGLDAGGEVGFANGGTNLKLDNLMISKPLENVPNPVIVPTPDDTVNVLAYENFENGLEKWTYWDGQDRAPSAEDGNVDGKTGSHVLNCVEYNYYMAGTGWKDYTLEVNWFADQYDGSWPAINFQISGGKKNNLYIDSGDELVLETRDGGYYNKEYNFKNDNGKWAYFRIEHYGDNVKVFYNSKTEPLLDVTETGLDAGGEVGFANGGTNLKLDNLMISKPFRNVPIPVYNPDTSEMIYQNDFESGDTSGWGNTEIVTDVGADGSAENKAYKVTQYNDCQGELIGGHRNYTIEFNMKIDYKNSDGDYGTTWPNIYFRNADNKRYNLYFNTQNEAPVIAVEKRKNNEWIATMGESYVTGFTEENDRWAYLKIEAYGNEIKVYYMDKENPCITFTDTDTDAPFGGGLTINDGDAPKFYVDNILITAKKAESVPEAIEADTDRETLLFQDYEDGQARGWGGNVSVSETANGKALSVQDAISTSRKDFSNVIMDFNICVNYYDQYGKVNQDQPPNIYFNQNGEAAYRLEFNTRLTNGGNMLALIKKKADGGEEWLGWPVVWVLDDNDAWVRMRITVQDGEINVYYKDMEHPVITAADTTPLTAGAIGFSQGNAQKFLVDDLRVTTTRPGNAVQLRRTFQDTENGVLCTVTAVSFLKEQISAVALLAGYKDGQLADIAAKDVTLTANPPDGRTPDADSFSLTMPGKQDDYDELKLLLWKDLSGIRVLSSVQEQTQAVEEKAEHQLCVEAKRNDFDVCIEGSMTNGSGREVSLLVLRPGFDSAALDISNLKAAILMVDQLSIGDTNSFSMNFSLTDDESDGIYQVLAGSEFDEECRKTTFNYIETSRLNKFLADINEVTTGEALAAILTNPKYETVMETLSLEQETWKTMGQKSRTEAGALLLAERPEEGFTAETLPAAVKRSIAVGMMRDCRTAAEIQKLFQTRQDLYPFSEEDWKAYAGLEEDVCEGLYHNLSGYRTPEDIAKDFTLQIVFSKLFRAHYDAVQQILDDNEKLLVIDSDKARNVKNPYTVYTGLNKKRYFDIETFRTDYQNLLKNDSDSPGGGSGSGSVGGSGGGGGRSDSRNSALTALLIDNGTVSTLDPMVGVKFTDVFAGHWAYTPISELAQQNIICGFEDGSFLPDVAVTRAEFTKMLVKALNLNTGTGTVQFTDVDTALWYAPYVTAAAEQGLVSGVGDGYFLPEAEMKREDVAIILQRAVQWEELQTEEEEAAFLDSGEISEYARSAVKAAEKSGLMKGSEGYFYPQRAVTRAETAQIIYRMLALQ